jgi:replicative DNA helicase
MAERTFSPAAANSDPGLETRLLASLNPDTWDEAKFANLDAAMFSSRECRALYEQMEQAAAKREAFPKVDGEPVGDVGEAARRVVELYQRRLLAVALDGLRDGLAENRDVTDVISRVEAALAAARLAAGDRVGEARSFVELLPAIMANARAVAEARAEGRPLGLQTGIPRLDKLIGGLQTGLHVLAAEPGAGKTTLCLQWAREAAARGIPALFLTFDETPERLALKTLCAAAGLPQKEYAEGFGDLAKLEQARQEWAEKLRTLYFIEGAATMTVSQLRARTMQAMERHGAETAFVVVDYTQRWAGGRYQGGGEFRHDIGKLIGELRDELANPLRIPVLAVSSQNRAGQGTAQFLSLAESSSLEYTGDTVMFLQEDKESAAIYPNRAVKLVVKKNRFGDVDEGGVPLIFKPAFGKLLEEAIHV